MDSGLLTMMEGHTRTLWSAAATLPQSLPESVGPEVIAGLARSYLPAAALDLAIHLSQTRPCGEGKAPSPRREWKPASRFLSPIAEVRFGHAALPAHSKTVRNP